MIQFVVLKKEPNNKVEHLEYATEAEKLHQLSNVTLENKLTQAVQPVNSQYAAPLLPTSSLSADQSFSNRTNHFFDKLFLKLFEKLVRGPRLPIFHQDRSE